VNTIWRCQISGAVEEPENLTFFPGPSRPITVPYREGVPESPFSKLSLSSPFQRKGNYRTIRIFCTNVHSLGVVCFLVSSRSFAYGPFCEDTSGSRRDAAPGIASVGRISSSPVPHRDHLRLSLRLSPDTSPIERKITVRRPHRSTSLNVVTHPQSHIAIVWDDAA
jgi:hypothetical protein